MAFWKPRREASDVANLAGTGILDFQLPGQLEIKYLLFALLSL